MNSEVLLVGAYGSGNLGDDLLYEIAIDSLLKIYDAHEIAVMCKGANSEYLKTRSPNIKLVGKQESYKLEVDLLVYGGGTQFFKYAKTQSHLFKVLYGLNNPKYLFKKLTKTLNQEITAKNAAMLGIGFGPFESGTDFTEIIKQLNKCNFVWLRDQWSHNFCKQHGAEHAMLGADIAFSSAFRSRLKDASNFVDLSKSSPPEEIGIIVRDWPYGERQKSYIASIIHLAKELRSQGENIKFITFSRENDLPFDDLKALGTLLRWSPTDGSSTDFIVKLSTCKYIITSRYHGAIFSSLLGRPVIGINIDPKIEYFFHQIGMQEMLWSYPFEVSDCLKKIAFLKNHYPEHKYRASVAIDELTTLSDKMMNEFETFIKRFQRGKSSSDCN